MYLINNDLCSIAQAQQNDLALKIVPLPSEPTASKETWKSGTGAPHGHAKETEAIPGLKKLLPPGKVPTEFLVHPDGGDRGGKPEA